MVTATTASGKWEVFLSAFNPAPDPAPRLRPRGLQGVGARSQRLLSAPAQLWDSGSWASIHLPLARPLETPSLRKRRERHLRPAPLAGSTMTIGLPPASSLLGASAATYAFSGLVKASSWQRCVPLPAGNLEGWDAASQPTRTWECFGARSSLPPRPNGGACRAACAPLKESFSSRMHFLSEAGQRRF